MTPPMPTLRNNSPVQFNVLHLVCWPALSELRPEAAQDVARLCALLARRPSAGMLVPTLLNMPPQIAYALMDTLLAQGHIRPATTAEHRQRSGASALPAGSSAVQASAESASFLVKLWQRLSARA